MGHAPALHVRATCRGEGLGYVVVGSKDRISDFCVIACDGQGTSVPVSWFPLEEEGVRRRLTGRDRSAFVLVLPLFSCDVRITCVVDGRAVRTVTFSALSSKFASRALTLSSPEVAHELRGFERTHGAGRTQVRIVEGWPTRDGLVSWRVEVRFPTHDAAATATLEVMGSDGRMLGCETICLEDHVVPDARDASRHVRLVTFSALIEEACTSFCCMARIGDDDALMGFDAMNAPRGASLVAASRSRTGGAATDGSYARWFERHRASDAELAWQREQYARLEHRPLISLVMCVYRPEPDYLAHAISSVVAQTYAHFELIVVNASGVCAGVDDVLSSVRDERVRVVKVQNASIAENTNAGIARATGEFVGFIDHDDVLEPDCLWHYVQAIAAHPEVDLLYCDEDHLRDAHVASPALKGPMNVGKLYCHNYVTHLLMVSARSLGLTERSGADVSGAQDYDLTLKVMEVAREVVHVPRVLYHWREHALSTSAGAAQKPYAHKAGALALARHLERRGIAAVVEDGVVPCSYHVRFELAERPLVSVVIPTRDQATLLERCVGTLLERTSYESLEVVLVENGSVEDETFALYERLCAQDQRVHVVSWLPAKAGAPFNYSAVVNFGVARTHGDYVVVLNNDTEVIEGGWLEEMLGQFARPEVGLVGAKLLFADDTVQHVGMVANPDGNLCHVCRNLARDAFGAGFWAQMPGDQTMVTGACHMFRRSLFEEVGGYDERLGVGYNDADLCLRVREAGFVVTLAADALLYHREFATRGREVKDARLAARHLKERSYFIARHPELVASGDPALNPNCDPYSAYFELRRQEP